jgi:aspartate-semialdehyde dehydrogenase
MSDQILLCVPEVNGDELPKANSPQIIANPNCSTIQLVVALKPLCDRFGVSRVNVATYQAVSGAGKAAREELLEQSRGGVSSPKVFSQPIAYNCLPQIGSFSADGFCGEETKIMRETKKILNDAELKISAWTVRVPALNSHSEACWITLKTPVSKSDIISALEGAPGLKVMSEPKDYPTALAASGTDDVYVGRIHQDLDSPDTWLMWIVADNIRKGAALNGLQIAERIFK